jgi:hypothetical protein
MKQKSMTKLLLALFVFLSLTACRERRGPEPRSSQTMIETVYVQKVVHETPKEEVSTHVEIPVLEDTLPTLPTPIEPTEETMTKPSIPKGNIQTFSGGNIEGDLDIKNIRYSQSTQRTRLVLDTYKNNEKTKQSGQYTFSYYPNKKRISAVLHGYTTLSALGSKKERYYEDSSFIEKLNIEKYKDNSGYKLTIDLMHDAKVNVFELMNPARIVIDVTPR